MSDLEKRFLALSQKHRKQAAFLAAITVAVLVGALAHLLVWH